MLMEDMSRNKCFFSRFEYYIFYVVYPFVTYLLTLARTSICRPHLVYFDNLASKQFHQFDRLQCRCVPQNGAGSSARRLVTISVALLFEWGMCGCAGRSMFIVEYVRAFVCGPPCGVCAFRFSLCRARPRHVAVTAFNRKGYKQKCVFLQ
jgi:hypothetical protein